MFQILTFHRFASTAGSLENNPRYFCWQVLLNSKSLPLVEASSSIVFAGISSSLWYYAGTGSSLVYAHISVMEFL